MQAGRVVQWTQAAGQGDWEAWGAAKTIWMHSLSSDLTPGKKEAQNSDASFILSTCRFVENFKKDLIKHRLRFKGLITLLLSFLTPSCPSLKWIFYGLTKLQVQRMSHCLKLLILCKLGVGREGQFTTVDTQNNSYCPYRSLHMKDRKSLGNLLI